ncbi:protein of unknown function [Thermococcus nautili]|nr:protein of unknown function [Thermococcus nautili]
MASRSLSILLESYCNASLTTPAFTKSRLSILLESYCNLVVYRNLSAKAVLSILLESYCNVYLQLLNAPCIFLAFNSPRVLLQLGGLPLLWRVSHPLSILLESYCNPNLIRAVNQPAHFQFSSSLIATGSKPKPEA